MEDRNGLAFLLRQIKRDRNLDCDRYKEGFLTRRIAVRMRATSARDYFDYLKVLRESPEEYRMLFDELCINVTEFFRDKDVFKKIRDSVLPDIVEGKTKRGSRAITAWSAGCATGEEAYSVAALLLNATERALGEWRLSVLGTDVDKDALDVAKKGYYGADTAGSLGEYIRFFEPVKVEEKSFLRAGRILREITMFRVADLVEFNPSRKFDLILCRNVLIYFSKEVQVRIIQNFAGSLRNGGYLVLGKTETLLDKDCGLEPVYARERIYRLSC